MATKGGNHGNTATANTGSRREIKIPEFLHLRGEDHPGMVLVSAPFDGTYFWAWRRSIVIALHAKMKLRFIDGTFAIPDKTSNTYETWIPLDPMVTSWILNAITMKISKAFLHTKSSRQLWLDLEERYGENNGLLVYQLQRVIASMTQRMQNVVEYFNSLTTLWDELECLMPTKTYTCDDCYDNICSQILVMDPFPTVNKAYSMVLRVERQRLVNLQTTKSSEGVALHSKWNDNRGNFGQCRDVQQQIQYADKGNFKGRGYCRSHPTHAPPMNSHAPTPSPTTTTNPPIEPSISAPTPPSPAVRHSHRHITQPLWLQDYIYNHSTLSPHHCDVHSFSSAHLSFLAQLKLFITLSHFQRQTNMCTSKRLWPRSLKGLRKMVLRI
ncbi:hypothetical protein Sango_2436800 [Sesamum angolense]|uniref:Retrotransposon Copia-like N-terminal domain-containing protein n=1 Tax=Sesamum angolense TaxID=2727404 RepID=A0AAE1W7S6_9LAMI|nr:hypothetical protein Sango_2436800 [Sesamum angolense]